jgi:hypothetical protein
MNCRCDGLFSPGIGKPLATKQDLFPTRPYLGRFRPAALQRDDDTLMWKADPQTQARFSVLIGAGS